MERLLPKNEIIQYLTGASSATRRQYLVLVRFYIDQWETKRIADEYGYTESTIYTITRNFMKSLAAGDGDPFFIGKKPGRKKMNPDNALIELVLDCRKKYYSVPEIKTVLDARGFDISERTVTNILTEHGFARLPRRADDVRNEVRQNSKMLDVPKSHIIHFDKLEAYEKRFSTREAGLLCFLPIIRHYGIDTLIHKSEYPQTREIKRLPAILSFLALKLTSKERFSADNSWCVDRGMGLFAGLSALPKTAWFSSYSHGITRAMNLAFLRAMRDIWDHAGLLSDTANLDFTAIPYWGDDKALENNWSGKRGKALASLQAVLAQDPENGILCYGDTTVRHENEANAVLEFLDFCHTNPNADKNLRYLVFDSRFTTYRNLGILNKKGVKFVTIQRRGAALLKKIAAIPKSEWKEVLVEKANNKHRAVLVSESRTELKDYDGVVRQIFLNSKEREKPAVIITNDMKSPVGVVVRKYALRWMVEKEISEQIHFFHLNRNSSGIVVKVDFDLAMSILAHNLCRLLAMQFEGYGHCEAETINHEFTDVGGNVVISNNRITVKLNRTRTLKYLLEAAEPFDQMYFPWLNNKKLAFVDAKTT